jgi:hypothetical protein
MQAHQWKLIAIAFGRYPVVQEERQGCLEASR